MSESQQNKPLNLLAGIWFAVASCLPLSLLWIELFLGSGEKPLHIFVAKLFGYCVMPVAISGVCGQLLGSDILEPDRVGTAKRAMLRGWQVALSSFLIYALLLGLFAGIWMSISEDIPGGGSLFDRIGLLFVGLVGTFILGLITVGWMAMIVGAIAGWLLYKLRLVLHKRAA